MEPILSFEIRRSAPFKVSEGRSIPGYLGIMGFAECEIAKHHVKVEIEPCGPSDKESNKIVSQFVDELYALLDKHGVKLPPNPLSSR